VENRAWNNLCLGAIEEVGKSVNHSVSRWTPTDALLAHRGQKLPQCLNLIRVLSRLNDEPIFSLILDYNEPEKSNQSPWFDPTVKRTDTVGELGSTEMCVSQMPSWKAKTLEKLTKKKYF
jgi:hypothetical protein